MNRAGRKPVDPVARFWPKVEKTDGCWNWLASKTRGYGRFDAGDNKRRSAHRFSYELENGPIGSGLVLDHTCHNPGCVNPEHLRPVTPKQNSENRRGPDKDNKTGVRGVYWNKSARKYQTTIRHNQKTYYAGSYDTIAEAEAAVIAKRLELHTHNDLDRISA